MTACPVSVALVVPQGRKAVAGPPGRLNRFASGYTLTGRASATQNASRQQSHTRSAGCDGLNLIGAAADRSGDGLDTGYRCGQELRSGLKGAKTKNGPCRDPLPPSSEGGDRDVSRNPVRQIGRVSPTLAHDAQGAAHGL